MHIILESQTVFKDCMEKLQFKAENPALTGFSEFCDYQPKHLLVSILIIGIVIEPFYSR